MKRKIEEALGGWLNKENRKPLVVFGARQTGKTTSVKRFAQQNFDDVVHIDFYKQPKYKAAFAGDLRPEGVIAAIGALSGRAVEPGRTLLFLDEIQDCAEALTSLKFFKTDMPDLHVVAAGSLLGVHVAREGSFPVGYVDMLAMRPMDFEEFCWARNEEAAFGLARKALESMAPCLLHDHLMLLYREYLMVGGMPEVVARHAKGASLEEVRAVQREIATAYIADMTKYATTADSVKILACWDSLPAQLAKETDSTKFSWKMVARGARADRYQTALNWLRAAGLVNVCTQVSDGVAPLKAFESKSSFKVYVGDTGLLSCMYDASPDDLEDKGPRSARFRGGMAENYVMQQLVSAGLTPYYWGVSSTYEIEFVVSLGGDGVVPVEVKPGRRTQSPSVRRFVGKYDPPYAVKVSAKNFGYEGGVKSIPLYAVGLLGEM